MATQTTRLRRSQPKKKRPRRRGKPAPRQNSLNRDLWLEFLEKGMSRTGGKANEPTLFNGRRLLESHARSLHRWSVEGASPDIFSGDAWTIYFLGRTIDVFFQFCERKGRSPWALGVPPRWHDDDDWGQDLESSDPMWRRDCRQEHGRRSAPVPVAA
jgi:hypothetical protein